MFRGFAAFAWGGLIVVAIVGCGGGGESTEGAQKFPKVDQNAPVQNPTDPANPVPAVGDPANPPEKAP